MAPVVRKLFHTRAKLKSFIDTSIDSLGVLLNVCDGLKKYGLFSYFDQWFIDSSFTTYFTWKLLYNAKFENLNLMHGLRLLLTTVIYKLRKIALKKHLPANFCLFLNSSPIWSAVFVFRLMGSLGLNGEIP